MGGDNTDSLGFVTDRRLITVMRFHEVSGHWSIDCHNLIERR